MKERSLRVPTPFTSDPKDMQTILREKYTIISITFKLIFTRNIPGKKLKPKLSLV